MSSAADGDTKSGKGSRTRRYRQDKQQEKGASLAAQSAVEIALLSESATGTASEKDAALSSLSPSERRYLEVVQAWRAVFLPTLCAALTHPSRETRVRAPMYLLSHVLKLDPVSVLHVLLGIRRQPCEEPADDGMSAGDRRLWAMLQVWEVSLHLHHC